MINPERENFRNAVVADTVRVSRDGGSITLGALYRGEITAVTIQADPAAGGEGGACRDHARTVINGVLEMYEWGLGRLIDTRLKNLQDKYRDGWWKTGQSPAEVCRAMVEELGEIRREFKVWGKDAPAALWDMVGGSGDGPHAA